MAAFLPHPLLLHSFLHLLSVVLIAFSLLWLLKPLSTIWSSRWKAANPPPGSCGLPLIGETVAFILANNSSKGFYDFVQARRLRYGNCFKTSIFGETHVFISSIEATKAILVNDSAEFSKRYMKSIAGLLGEESLLCASHEQHRLIRRGISDLFTTKSLSSTIKLFDELTVKVFRSWERREHVVVLDDAMKVTFRVICKMLISLDREDELEMLQQDVSELSEAMLSFPLKLPQTRFYRGLKARERIMKALKKMILKRRKGLECHEDFLQSLVMRDESANDVPLTDTQILDNILTLIIAGQVTTASAIAWMVKYLDENPEVQETLRESQLQLSLKNPHLMSLGLETLNEMPYATKVVKESLRMATIVSWFPRVVLKDCQIEGFQIQKGSIVNVDARSIHFDPAVYDKPSMFNPSRFDEDPKPYSFLAFGTGGRTCLGMNLAKAMMLVFLHRLVTTYRWKVTDPDSSLAKSALFPRLRSGCPVRVTPI